MKTMSEFHAEPHKKVLVWDAPVRAFHWLMVLAFAGAYITAESEVWRLLHVTLGYTMAGLVVFRIVWGFVGTRHARFASFVRGPSAIRRYFRSFFSGSVEHHTGHNPAGALAILVLIFLSLLVAASGWATYNEISGEWVARIHDAAANFMMLVVVVHVAAVVISGLVHKENLVRSMLSGFKNGSASEAIDNQWFWLAVVILLAVLAFWWYQFTGTP